MRDRQPDAGTGPEPVTVEAAGDLIECEHPGGHLSGDRDAGPGSRAWRACAATRCRTSCARGVRAAEGDDDGAATKGAMPGVARPVVSGWALGAGDGGDCGRGGSACDAGREERSNLV